MIRNPPPSRRRAALAAAAVALVAMACGGDPAAEPPPEPSPPAESAAPAPEPPQPESPPEPPPEETAAPAPQPESPPEPESPPGELFAIHVDADTVWRDVFDSASVAEQSCIRDELGDDVLDSVLEVHLLTDDDADESVVSIFDCLTPDNARSLFLAGVIAGLREDPEIGELSDGEMSCLRDLVADLDVVALVAADAAGEGDLEFAEATAVVIGCLPDVFLASILAELGVGLDDLSEDELSCLREWMSATDWAALVSVEDDAEALEAFEGLFDLISCVPGLFDVGDPQAAGPDDHGDFVEESTVVTVGEPVHGGIDHPGDFDVFVFDAVAGETYRVEVALGSLGDSVVSLIDADGFDLAFNDDRDEESLGSLITWTAPASGSYHVEVTSFDGFGLGSYTLSVTTE